MGDMAEHFRALKEAAREKRRVNTESSTRLLKDRRVPFVSYNGGTHLVIDGRVDFWPATGLFIPRNSKQSRGRGVHNLLRFLGAHNQTSNGGK